MVNHNIPYLETHLHLSIRVWQTATRKIPHRTYHLPLSTSLMWWVLHIHKSLVNFSSHWLLNYCRALANLSLYLLWLRTIEILLLSFFGNELVKDWTWKVIILGEKSKRRFVCQYLIRTYAGIKSIRVISTNLFVW